MGRRKIEIKPIKDDRNRSVTFLKRKGGLFKKAYELSVLCSVDVAVVIFGQNRKLYEFSSGDIHEILGRHQYYTSAHEHKGPSDFQDKDAGDDDDEEGDPSGSPGPEENAPPPNEVNYSHQAAMHHMRHGSNPSNSNTPPMPNGAFGGRMSSVEPQSLSRPDSRNQHQQPNLNFTPQNHAQMRAAQQQLAYQQNAAYLQARQNMQMHSNQGTPQMHPGQPTAAMQRAQHAYSLPVAPPHSQMQQMYLEEQRRQSMPPHSHHDRSRSVPAFRDSPPQMSRPFESPPMPGSPKLAQNGLQRSHSSIYTPIGDDSSMLAQHWTSAPTSDPMLASTSAPQPPNMQPTAPSASDPQPSKDSPQAPFTRSESNQRSNTTPSIAQDQDPKLGPPVRVNSLDAKRPRLAIQIPTTASSDEASGSGAVTNTSPEQSRTSAQANNTTPPRPGPSQPATKENSHARRGSVVLPPPSPSQPTSANPTLSAGATGPSNPFARPPPPSSHHTQPHALNTNLLSAPSNTKDGGPDSTANNITTPISALPSRFMSNDGLLPSPSSFYPEWGLGLVSAGGFSAGVGNSLQSPGGMLMWQPTPIREGSGHQWPAPVPAKAENTGPAAQGQGQGQATDDDKKRKPDAITPVEPGDAKRPR